MSATQSGSVRFAKFSIASATTTTLVAAVSGKSIVVVSLNFSMTGTTPTAKFQDNTGTPVVLTGTFDASGVYNFEGSREAPLFSTSLGKQLDVVTGGTPSMQGCLSYLLVAE